VKAEPLDVQPRWLVHVAFVLLLLAIVVSMAMLRTTDLEFDEDVSAAVVLALCFWVFAIALASLVRSVRAGYALRLDAAGLHIPGLEVVPWSAVRDARLVSERGGKRLHQVVVKVEPGYSGARIRHYERYLFGPVAGLFGPRDTIAIAVRLLAIVPDVLAARMRAFIVKPASTARGSARAGAPGHGARGVARRRSP
jgi:hypothetical protein